MTVYTEVSKKIGWDSRQVEWPSVQQAISLLNAVKSDNEEEARTAFEKAFMYHRFLPSPETSEQCDADLLIHRAFLDGCIKYK